MSGPSVFHGWSELPVCCLALATRDQHLARRLESMIRVGCFYQWSAVCTVQRGIFVLSMAGAVCDGFP